MGFVVKIKVIIIWEKIRVEEYKEVWRLWQEVFQKKKFEQ